MTTPEQHNKFLGIAHLAYAGLHTLMGLLFGALMVVMLGTIPPSPGNRPPPTGLFLAMAAFILIFTVGWVIPSMIAGFALLKRKRWAKTASIVAAVFAAAQLPIGTAVAVYTFWFAFGDVGRSLYEPAPPISLPNPRADSGICQGQQEEPAQFPPATPPDWR